MSHTPGPWKLCAGKDGSICKCFSISSADYPIATIENGEWGDSYPSLRFVGSGEGSLGAKVEAYQEFTAYGAIPLEAAEANARLIAAAPDGHDLIRRAVSDQIDDKWLKDARAYLANVEGK